MNVLFVAMGTQTPGSRFRVQQFFPHFERHGIGCTLRTAYGAEYNRLARGKLAVIYKLACRVKRGWHTARARGFDVVFVQRTALPFTAWPERVATRSGVPLIFDFDDAIYLSSRGGPSRVGRQCFDEAVRLSTRVLAGNAYLAEQAAAPAKTSVVPTVVDADRYCPGPGRDPSRFVIGWMGTAVNLHELDPLVPAIMRTLERRPNATFRVVSNGRHARLPAHPQIEQVAWTAETELAQLRSFDVGLMPLTDTPWTRGKCGFKLIQYMSVGTPVIASAVGANIEILDGSGAGYLVPDGGDWFDALSQMAASPAHVREAMGAAARARVVSRYSVESVLPVYLSVFREAAAGKHD